MWEYQQHIQISFKVSAECLFNQIDSRLQPSVFLLGILTEDRDNRHPICLEPDGCGFEVECFQNIKILAKELLEVDEDRRLIHSHPIAQESHNKRIEGKAYIGAIKKILKREDVYNNVERFVSFPTYIDGYWVFTILELNKNALNKYYSLLKEKSNRFRISRSFIESVIEVFLKECSNALKDPTKSLGAIERPAEELIREAGENFMYTIALAGSAWEGLHGLYLACCNISSLKYEGEDSIGKMAVAAHNHPNVKLILQLKEPIPIRDFRKVRKFLELSNADSLIVSDSHLIYGLGKLVGNYNPNDESLFIIDFISHHHWTVSHDGQVMMLVKYWQPNVPQEKIDRNYYESLFKRLFIEIEQEQMNDLWEIVIEATKQRHGTMIIISGEAEEEAKRLANPSFLVKPFKLEMDLVNQVTSIDGSVLLDTNCRCHAIGIIIDGVATQKGDSSRGARYNSAIRYYESIGSSIPTIIIVVSEDGMVNIIPNLRPQIKHSDLTEAIIAFRAMAEAEHLIIKEFNQAMTFFNTYAFYLSQEECDEINNLRHMIEEKNKSCAARIVYKDLKPDKEMNDSYYF